MAINVSTDATSLSLNNPLLGTWDGPHELPPFAQLRAEHFAPAFDAALAAHLAKIEALSAQTAAPDFSNPIVSFDQSGRVFSASASCFITRPLQRLSYLCR